MCSMPCSTWSELSKTPPSLFFKALSSFSEDVLSRLRRLLSSSTSSRASAAKALAFEAASATRASRPAMLFVTSPTNSWTSCLRFAALWSSALYDSRTSLMNVALCAEMVCAAVRKCSRTSLTTFPTVCLISVTEVLASCTVLATSARSFSSWAASAFPVWRSATVFSRVSNMALVFFSSPATLARPVSSPQSSSVRELCFSSRPAMRTSTSAAE
mmetsp:Transcript_1936/g.4397  ORF Transcript_1936/g.4397 Transcript_1936/m.4397 type:complete len:215 (-) Transcript_1936:570-1214(-)